MYAVHMTNNTVHMTNNTVHVTSNTVHMTNNTGHMTTTLVIWPMYAVHMLFTCCSHAPIHTVHVQTHRCVVGMV